ncbi:hypothetical protein [Mesonia sp. K7]|uniref:hypothetical protein n=1 Tax=Mesonia sp. K7 TaxID=2218606 RepID=UPI000DAA8068|nr:hypothetical protein [Mesonia sp. K7]PZD79180.1 hypothetical protein DNG35_01440 [Mesonia sp. K7]
MKIVLKIVLIFVILIFLGILIISDIADRNQYYSKYTPEEELKIFMWKDGYDEYQDHRDVYKDHFNNEKYRFPRKKVSKVKLFKNSFLISRLTSTTISETNKISIIKFFNNPSNFDWSETTWDLSESEYILRFYNQENKVIGKIWFCLQSCRMTESEPFSPSMKYGGLSKNGRKKLKTLIDKILSE